MVTTSGNCLHRNSGLDAIFKVNIVKRLMLSVLFFSSLATSGHSAADYSTGVAVGNYLVAVDMVEKFFASEFCNYLPNKKHLRFNEQVNLVRRNIRAALVPEFDQYLASREFQNERKDNQKIIEGFFRAGNKDGLDNKTLCGMMLMQNMLLLNRGEQSLRKIGIDID